MGGNASIQAIEAVAEAVRRATQPTEHGAARLAALAALAKVTHEHGKLAVDRALATISDAMIAPLDPSAMTWSVFRIFEREDSETAWTTWLASVLSPEHGATLSALLWRSLCDAIVARSADPVPCADAEHGVLASLDDWRAARDSPLPLGSVDRECAAPGLGRTDVVINAPGLYVVIENKLQAGWHDGEERQAVRYRDFGLTYRSPDQRLGLVLLTNRRDFRLDDGCADYVRIEYRDLARALRRNLRASFVADLSPAAMLACGPALLTVAAIEQDLLGMHVAALVATARDRAWRSIEALNGVVDHLREEV